MIDFPTTSQDGTAHRTARHGLRAPDLAAAHAAVLRILPGMCAELWPRLLCAAGLTGTETDPQSLSRLLQAMARCGDPVVALCARSLDIRLATYALVGPPSCDLSAQRASANTASNPRQDGHRRVGRAQARHTSRAGEPVNLSHPSDTEVALLDRAGLIVWVNQAWRDFGATNGGSPHQDWTRVSYLAACAGADDPGTQAVTAALHAALAGDLPAPVAVRIPCHSLREERWYDVLISSRYANTGICVGATITLSPATSSPA